MRLGVQVGAVHRIHDVVDGVAIVAAPVRGAEDRTPLRRVELLGIVERHGLGMQLIAEIGENPAHVLEGGIGLHSLRADQGAVADRGHRENGAAAVDLQPVIPAGQAVAEVPALRELRAPMRAAVGKHVDPALSVAPDDDTLAEAHQRDRLVADHPARRDRVPSVADAEIDERIHRVLMCRHPHLHPAPLRTETDHLRLEYLGGPPVRALRSGTCLVERGDNSFEIVDPPPENLSQPVRQLRGVGIRRRIHLRLVPDISRLVVRDGQGKPPARWGRGIRTMYTGFTV